MINKFSDYDDIQVFEGGAQLEPGGYELKIINAKVEQFTNCEILKVAFDIINNDKYAGFYSTRFKSAKAQNANAKWGGVFDVFIPKDDGTENDGYTKQAFKRFITSVERSNGGYTWNWDENSLKGKMFGGVFGREQFQTKEGDLKFAIKCRFPRSIESIRSGDFQIPKDKLLKNHDELIDKAADKEAQQLSGMPQQFVAQDSVLADYEEILGDNEVPF